jgi:hypothetical protein
MHYAQAGECCEKSVGDIVARMGVKRRGGYCSQACIKRTRFDGGVRNQESEELPFLLVGGKIGSTQKEDTVLHGTFLMPDRILL